MRPETGPGTVIRLALDRVGINSERIENWLGVPCGCREREEKLNAVTAWARRVVQGRVDSAREYLTRLLNNE